MPSEGEAFYERLAAHARVPYVALDPGRGGHDPVDRGAASLLPAWLARTLRLLTIAADAERVVVALPDPADVEALEPVRRLTEREVSLVVASPEAIARAQDRVYGRPASPFAAVSKQQSVARGLRHGEPTAAKRRRAERFAHHAGLAFASLEPGPEGDPVDPVAARALPEHVCRLFHVLPLGLAYPAIRLATADPSDEDAVQSIYALTGYRPELVVVPAGELERAIERAFATPPVE